jgi:TonB family protein
MKKSALICAATLLAIAGVFSWTMRAGAQAKPTAANSAEPGLTLPPIDKEKIRAHVKFLASDLLEGRGTGQRGGDIAAEYIGTQFESYGLKPAGDNGTFYQDVPMVGVKTLPESTFNFVDARGKSFEAKNLADIVTSNESQAESADIDAPIVFVGYGIKAPEYGWDDYKTTDLHGKVALLFVNQPISDDPAFFKGKTLTYYGRWTYKYEETARRGAVATLIIHRTDLASYGWEVVRNSWGTERSYLKRDATPKLQAASWIQLDVAKKLVGLAGLDLDKLFESAQKKDFKPVELPVHFKAHVASQLKVFVSRNVLGIVPGSDPAVGKEAILYTAHYDHFGIDPNLKGHNIYNGANDNGTGCGILLELARVWGAMPTSPRSILFAAVTAEEQGLLGSEYLGKHSPIPPAKISLDLNFDNVPPLGTPEEVEVSGAERTTFYPIVKEVAESFHLTIRPDARPEAGHYYRSDHFSLARVGIPAFSINEGMKYVGHPVEWGLEQAKDYTAHRYHQPTDQYSPDMDFTGDAVIAEFGRALGFRAAHTPLIGWLPGDEFEPARKKSLAANAVGRLFEDLPALRVSHYDPVYYPPLAAQARIAGTVRLHVVVDQAGAVAGIAVLSGHPILALGAKDNMQRWKFEPLGASGAEFDIAYEFAIGTNPEFALRPQVSFPSPGHILIVTGQAVVEPARSASQRA